MAPTPDAHKKPKVGPDGLTWQQRYYQWYHRHTSVPWIEWMSMTHYIRHGPQIREKARERERVHHLKMYIFLAVCLGLKSKQFQAASEPRSPRFEWEKPWLGRWWTSCFNSSHNCDIFDDNNPSSTPQKSCLKEPPPRFSSDCVEKSWCMFWWSDAGTSGWSDCGSYSRRVGRAWPSCTLEQGYYEVGIWLGWRVILADISQSFIHVREKGRSPWPVARATA
jgi:hypothetical protein